MFEKQFELRYFEMNRYGEASPATLLALLEETAADHCLAIRQGLYDLRKRNIGWVLVSGCLRMERYPRYKEKITVRTWLSGYTAFKGFRENIVLDENGEKIGRANGLWIFFDIERRRPVKIFDAIREGWSSHPERAIPEDPREEIVGIEHGIYSSRRLVNGSDIDTNRHVNNIRYLEWLLETIPEDVMESNFLHRIDGRFTGEAHHGDRVETLTQPVNGGREFAHAVNDLDGGRTCAVARSIWSSRN